MSTENTKNNEWREREMGALWKRQSQNGNTTYLAGNLKGEGVVIFNNKNKKDNPKAPDFIVYKSKDRQQNSSASSNQQQASTMEDDNEEIL
tara:strand:+ start:526 stop:798 length:273 start_codon:yes stop_codon:yes gene_type:complete